MKPTYEMPRRPGARMSRRAFLRLAGAAAAGGTLAACGVAPAPEARMDNGNGGRIQLVYQDWRTAWFPEMAQRLLAEFHASHPNIRVFYTPDPENLVEQMPVDMEAGTAPDVLSGCCEWLPAWAQQGYLLDLKPYADADLDRATIDEWDPAQYRSFFTPDGRQFALPKYHGALALYYNKDLFDRQGVAYPDGSWTHDDYLDAMRLLTSVHPRTGEVERWGSMLDVAWDRLQVHVNAWGGHFVNPADSRISMMDRPESLAAMEWIRARMWDDQVMANFLAVGNLETRQAFIEERIAMVEDGSWALKDILVESDFGVGVAPMPAGPVRRATLATTDGFSVYAGTEHPDAAWELVKFLTSREYGLAMARANFLQPARASLVGEWASIIREELPARAEGVDLDAFADGHLNGYSVTAEVFWRQPPATELAAAAWEQIFTLGQMPTEHMVTVSEQIEAAQAGSE
ncbi:MAG TPA: sugar ABC transporter substrate-binding protein [Anaerolineae bacterium]|nr:sugar ABC transporter substrate-binding protein [Anaerolineae bacterium]